MTDNEVKMVAAEVAKASVKSVLELVNGAFVHYMNEHATAEGAGDVADFYVGIVIALKELDDMPVEVVANQLRVPQTPKAAEPAEQPDRPETPNKPQAKVVSLTDLKEILKQTMPPEVYALIEKNLPKVK